MQLGIHVMQRSALAALAARGIIIEGEAIGVVELVRQLEGLFRRPSPGRPLVIGGLDAFAAAAGGDVDIIFRGIRARLQEARRFFAQHAIPICFLVEGDVSVSVASGPLLSAGAREIALSALAGSALVSIPDVEGWWHAPL